MKRSLEVVVEKRDVVVGYPDGKAKSKEGGSNYMPAVKFSTFVGSLDWRTVCSHFTPFILALEMS